MGKIMLNGIQYGVGGIEQAKDISYDNTESGATATDVQGALDELNNGLLIEEVTIPTVTIPANSNIYDQVYNLPSVAGYTPWIVGGFWLSGAGYASCGFARLVINENQLKYAIFNSASSSATIEPRVKVVYKRN